MQHLFCIYTESYTVITTNQWLNPHKKVRKSPAFYIIYIINILGACLYPYIFQTIDKSTPLAFALTLPLGNKRLFMVVFPIAGSAAAIILTMKPAAIKPYPNQYANPVASDLLALVAVSCSKEM